MLRIDKIQTIAGTTVWGDDEQEHVFYAIPDQPRFRLTDDGKPVFKFLKYRLPIDREDGRRGGGFCFFDVEFTLDDTKTEEIKAELQGQVNQKLGAEGPRVELGQIAYTKGTTKLLLSEFAGGPLVEKVANAGTPSLFGKNITAFAVEFTPEGATLFEKALQGEGGVVQVVYDLQFPVKLPPVTARAWFNASQFYSFYQTIDTNWSVWGEDERKETLRESMVSNQVMGVELDVSWPAGTPADTAELTAQLRASMMQSLEDAVERNMIESIVGVDEEGRKLPESISDVTRDIQSTKASNITHTYSESSVLEFRLAPQGTLPNITSLPGVSWGDYATQVDLNDPFFKELNVTVQVNADFETLPLHNIEVHLEYHEGDTHEVGEYRFQKPDDIAKFATYVENDKWEYQYWYEVNYVGSSKTFKSEVFQTNEKTLTVNLDDTGIFMVDVVAGDINFSQVSSAQVTVEYQSGSKEKVEEQFTLSKDKTSHSITKVIFEPRHRPYRYKVKYFMTDGKEFTSGWTKARGRHLVVNDTFSEMKSVGLRAAGDLVADIEQIFVDLEYVDEANAYEKVQSAALSKDSPFFNWAFPVVSPTGGKVFYSGQVRFRDGTVSEIPRTQATGPTIMVGEVVADKLQVQILADLVDFTVVKLAKVSLEYLDDANDVKETFDAIFRPGATDPAKWSVKLKDKTRNLYKWRAAFFLTDGSQRTTDWEWTSDPTLVLQVPEEAAPPTKSGKGG